MWGQTSVTVSKSEICEGRIRFEDSGVWGLLNCQSGWLMWPPDGLLSSVNVKDVSLQKCLEL